MARHKPPTPSMYAQRRGVQWRDRVQVVKGPPDAEYLRKRGVSEDLIELLSLPYDDPDPQTARNAKLKCYRAIWKRYGDEVWQRVSHQKDLYRRMKFGLRQCYQLAVGSWLRRMCGETDVPELTDKDADGPVRSGSGNPKAALMRLAMAGRGRTSTRSQNIDWVNEWALFPYRDIPLDSVPSAAAVWLLRHAKADEDKYRARYDSRYEGPPPLPPVSSKSEDVLLPDELLKKYKAGTRVDADGGGG